MGKKEKRNDSEQKEEGTEADDEEKNEELEGDGREVKRKKRGR